MILCFCSIYKRGQDEIKILKIKLDELDKLIREQQHTMCDRDLSKYLNVIGSNKPNNLINEQTPYNTLQPKSLISSLLFTPSIRKSASYTNSDTAKFVEKNAWSGAGVPTCCTDQQNMFKESITKNFQENLNNLERSKVQTQNVIDNLRTSLSEIEILTANNIFKITSMNKPE